MLMVGVVTLRILGERKPSVLDAPDASRKILR